MITVFCLKVCKKKKKIPRIYVFDAVFDEILGVKHAQ